MPRDLLVHLSMTKVNGLRRVDQTPRGWPVHLGMTKLNCPRRVVRTMTKLARSPRHDRAQRPKEARSNADPLLRLDFSVYLGITEFNSSMRELKNSRHCSSGFFRDSSSGNCIYRPQQDCWKVEFQACKSASS
ncbi:hypothetical protein NE237_003092 [Protea cynaroides]|uniref:Uncharacterized protein n=1 Tax=Protea cynaroides TaxID=273540 RepID=A0A9Q0KG19_9MAGN|nr:hypothetical protein NE237_003092 [Protea cynaroides]